MQTATDRCTHGRLYLPPQLSYFPCAVWRSSSYFRRSSFMLSTYFLNVLLSDILNEISDLSERGVCDRPERQQHRLKEERKELKVTYLTHADQRSVFWTVEKSHENSITCHVGYCESPVYYPVSIILGQCGVWGISSAGHCQLDSGNFPHSSCTWSDPGRGGMADRWKGTHFSSGFIFCCLLAVGDLICLCNRGTENKNKKTKFCSKPMKLHKSPCPHLSTLTCVSLTMETFSFRVGGGICYDIKNRKAPSASLIIAPLLESCSNL